MLDIENNLRHLETIIRMAEDNLIRDFNNGADSLTIERKQRELSYLRMELSRKKARAL